MSLTGQLLAMTPDRTAMRYMAQLMNGLYRNELPLWLGPGTSNLRQLSTVDPPGVWAFERDGETIVILPGTTSFGETAAQIDGWARPTEYDGGYINSYYKSLVDAIYPTLPERVDVIAGHSMGGALAILLGRRMHRAGREVGVVFALTPSRPVSKTVADDGHWPLIVSVHNQFDPVPDVPFNISASVRWRTPALNRWLITPTTHQHVEQQDASAVSLLTIFAAVQDTWHAVDTYVSLLRESVPTVQLFTESVVPFLERFTMPNICRVRVNAVLNDQACINDFHYVQVTGETDISLEDFLVAFRNAWETWVTPRVSNKYTVRTYDGFQGPSILLRATKEAGVYNPLMRYAVRSKLLGGSGATGVKSTDALPSFMAVNFVKDCSQWYTVATPPVVIPQTRFIRANFRLGGLVEADTVAAGDELTAGMLAVMTESAGQLRNIRAGASMDFFRMCVVSEKPDGKLLLDAGPPATATVGYAEVRSIVPDVIVTTQRSRKKAKAGV